MAWETRMRGAGVPPSAQPRWYPVMRGAAGDPVIFLLLGTALVGYWTHWMLMPDGRSGRTKPCYSPEDCAGCARKMGLNHYSYIAALRMRDKLRVVLSLPADAARKLLGMRPDHPTLRGIKLGVQKTGLQRTDPINVAYEGEDTSRQLAEPHPIGDSLCKLWSVRVLPGDEVVAGRIGGAS